MKTSEIENRFGFHSGARITRAAEFGALRSKAYELALLINEVAPDSREKSVALTELETALMWATKAVALTDPTIDPIESPRE